MNKIKKNIVWIFGLCVLLGQMAVAADEGNVKTNVKIVNNTNYYVSVKDLLEVKLVEGGEATWLFKKEDFPVVEPKGSRDITFNEGWNCGLIAKYSKVNKEGQTKENVRVFASNAELMFTNKNMEPQKLFRGVMVELSPDADVFEQTIAIGVGANGKLVGMDVKVKVKSQLIKTVPYKNTNADVDFVSFVIQYYDYTIEVSASEEREM